MNANRKPIRCATLALLVLFGACFVALIIPRFEVALVVAGFAGYVACTRRALALCRADDLVFDSKASQDREREAREAVRAGLLAGSEGAVSLGLSLNARSDSGLPRRRRTAFPRPLEGTR